MIIRSYLFFFLQKNALPYQRVKMHLFRSHGPKQYLAFNEEGMSSSLLPYPLHQCSVVVLDNLGALFHGQSEHHRLAVGLRHHLHVALLDGGVHGVGHGVLEAALLHVLSAIDLGDLNKTLKKSSYLLYTYVLHMWL